MQSGDGFIEKKKLFPKWFNIQNFSPSRGMTFIFETVSIYIQSRYIPAEIDHKLYVVAKKGVAVDPFEVFQILHY